MNKILDYMNKLIRILIKIFIGIMYTWQCTSKNKKVALAQVIGPFSLEQSFE